MIGSDYYEIRFIKNYVNSNLRIFLLYKKNKRKKER